MGTWHQNLGIEDEVIKLFENALHKGTDESIDELLVHGNNAVQLLKLVTLGQLKFDSLKGIGRVYVDNLNYISSKIAWNSADYFIEVFNNKEWLEYPHIVGALSWIHRPESEPLIINALLNSKSWSVRMEAAIGLGCFPRSETVLNALVKALEDKNYLVKDHVITTLGTKGNNSVLPLLYPFVTENSKISLEYSAKKAINNILNREQNLAITKMGIQYANDEKTFYNIITNSTKPVLVEFYSDGFGMSQEIEMVAEEKKDALTVVRTDTKANPVVANKYQVLTIPTFFLFKKGQLVAVAKGRMPKDKLLHTLGI
jgi:thioredoxin 1